MSDLIIVLVWYADFIHRDLRLAINKSGFGTGGVSLCIARLSKKLIPEKF